MNIIQYIKYCFIFWLFKNIRIKVQNRRVYITMYAFNPAVVNRRSSYYTSAVDSSFVQHVFRHKKIFHSMITSNSWRKAPFFAASLKRLSTVSVLLLLQIYTYINNLVLSSMQTWQTILYWISLWEESICQSELGIDTKYFFLGITVLQRKAF